MYLFTPPVPDSVGDDVRGVTSKEKKSEFRYLDSYAQTKVGRVWINDWQYVEGVPEAAGRFPIGGYLPAQRWLKDRLGRTLGFIKQEEHCRIIWALLETKRIMGDIDTAIQQHGGWPLRACLKIVAQASSL